MVLINVLKLLPKVKNHSLFSFLHTFNLIPQCVLVQIVLSEEKMEEPNGVLLMFVLRTFIHNTLEVLDNAITFFAYDYLLNYNGYQNKIIRILII